MPPTGSTAPSPSHDQTSAAVLGRIRRDVESGLASGEVRGTTTAWCTWAATTRPPCWRHWPDERDLLAHRQHRADRAAGSNRRVRRLPRDRADRKSTRLNSSHPSISYAVFCLKKK